MTSDNQELMVFMVKKKSMVVAYILWILLGGLGIHRFYLRKKTIGFVELTLTVLGIGFVELTSAVLGIILLPVWGICGFLLLICAVFLVVDLFLIPGITQRYNLALAQDLSHDQSAEPPKSIN